MRYAATITQHTLQFKTPARTSRNTLQDKTIWLLHLNNAGQAITGIGECSPLKGLSVDDVPGFENKLNEVVALINNGINALDLGLELWPSINFGLETALLDLKFGGQRKIFDTLFYTSKLKLPINGLVWMADRQDMLRQANEKIKAGYNCIKFKIGAIDFDEECRMLEELRQKNNAFKVEIRLDANGAFAPDTALEQLRELSRFDIHSVEQPIKPNQWEQMEEVCAKSKIAIALDEELIGRNPWNEGQKLLSAIKPQYIILKPGLLGGFKAADKWVQLAHKNQMGWWATSALESNVGLNAIAQFTSQYGVKIPQGLGTGRLYENNFDSPLTVAAGYIEYNPLKSWTSF